MKLTIISLIESKRYLIIACSPCTLPELHWIFIVESCINQWQVSTPKTIFDPCNINITYHTAEYYCLAKRMIFMYYTYIWRITDYLILAILYTTVRAANKTGNFCIQFLHQQKNKLSSSEQRFESCNNNNQPDSPWNCFGNAWKTIISATISIVFRDF